MRRVLRHGAAILALLLLGLWPGAGAARADALSDFRDKRRLVATHTVCSGAETLLVLTRHHFVGGPVTARIPVLPPEARIRLPDPEVALFTRRPGTGWVDAYRGTARSVRDTARDVTLSPASDLSLLMVLHAGLDPVDVTYSGRDIGRVIRTSAVCGGVTYVGLDLATTRCRTDRALIFTNWIGETAPTGWISITLRTRTGWIAHLETLTVQQIGGPWRTVAVTPEESARLHLAWHGNDRREADLVYRGAGGSARLEVPVVCRGDV